jgi:hypothetical protein
VLYAIVLGMPSKPVVLNSLGSAAGQLGRAVDRIELLGDTAAVAWKQDDQAITIQPPGLQALNDAVVYKITMK